MHDIVFASWNDAAGPRAVWVPSKEDVEYANLTHLGRRIGIEEFSELHRWSVQQMAAFWQSTINTLNIRFHTPPSAILDTSPGVERPSWLKDARLNIVASCFSADEDTTALIAGSPSGQLRRLSVSELRCLTNRVSNGLLDAGFAPGDAIAIDMAMTVESVPIYLGIIQAGCVAVSIADSFAAPQIAMRLDIASARGIFTADHIVRGGKRLGLYEKIVDADAPRAVVLGGPAGRGAALRNGDLRWQDFLSDNDAFEPHACAPHDAINVLFSSGTTGEPKAIPFDHTSGIKCAMDGHFHHDLHPGDVVAWPTNLGWMMGPWLIFAALLNRGTIALFEDAPLDRPFGQFVQDTRVTMLGLVPSLVGRWRQTACMEGLDWSTIRAFSSTGECSNPDDMFYLMHLAGYRPVIEYCGGTEISGGYISSTPIQPNAPSCFSTPAMGIDVVILDENGDPSDSGELFLMPPSMGLSQRLVSRDHGEVYYDGVPRGPAGQVLRRHGDHFVRLGGGYYRAQGRVDDTMNLGGIKASSAEIERALRGVSGVKETAAIACPPPGGGPDCLVIYTVMSDPAAPVPPDLRASMQKAISTGLNPLFKVHDVVVVDALPRTASQKVMRRQLRAQYQPKNGPS